MKNNQPPRDSVTMEFFKLLQAYRWTPITDLEYDRERFDEIVSAYESLKFQADKLSEALEKAGEKLDAWLSQYPKEDYNGHLRDLDEANTEIDKALTEYRKFLERW